MDNKSKKLKKPKSFIFAIWLILLTIAISIVRLIIDINSTNVLKFQISIWIIYIISILVTILLVHLIANRVKNSREMYFVYFLFNLFLTLILFPQILGLDTGIIVLIGISLISQITSIIIFYTKNNNKYFLSKK